jgi:signal transduction histidine kinase
MLERQARRLAEEKRRVRFEFVRVLGHELKAPLGAIAGYLDILATRTLGNDIGAYGQVVARSRVRLDQMSKLIEDLLDLTRIESGQIAREIVTVDLGDALRDAVESASRTAEERGIRIETATGGDLHLTGDRREIDMILNNLLSNAVKYNRDGGRVSVRIDGEPEHLRIEVSDTGIGMTPEETARLFGEFVRIRNAKTRNILGSGLGLSIIRKITQMYDGDVTVRSQPGVGTTFTVALRRHPPRP